LTWRQDKVGEIKQFLWVENKTPEATILCVEPWAEEIQLAPTSGVLLTVRSRFPGYLEVVYETDRITVWAWSGCRVWVRGRGGNPSVDLDIPVPDLPGTPFRRGFPE
jgi:hypothetical protein